MRVPSAAAAAAALCATLMFAPGACAPQTESAGPGSPGPTAEAAKADPQLEGCARQLFASLDPGQRQLALLPASDARRNEVVFPGGPRAGIPIARLDPRQHALVRQLIAGFTSPYGRQLCDEIVTQAGPEGLDRFYLAFFGEPGPAAAYAWRIAEHHLTLVDVEVAADQSLTVGPILLGSNPPEFFELEENNLIALYTALSAAERNLVSCEGKGPSGEAIVAAGAPLWKLSNASQERVGDVVNQRLAFYAPAIQARIRAIIAERGGIPAMHMAFYGAADRRCQEGGKWDWKFGGPTVLIDYASSGGHIHLSLKAESERGQDAR
jgi:Protein of unknown function (DUF3500)